MGGGASSLMESMEELMTTTVLIGRALSSVAFPGMFRIYDFHSRKAPRLKNARIIKFFPADSDEESGDEDENAPDPSEYEHFFKVMVGEDAIYLEDPLYENEAGWTALHACCTSLTTASAGLKIIDEIMRKGGSLEIRTKFGPGSFNKGWTPLQMACAYGVEPLVEKLIECGADANSCNSFGFSCLLEASHRGFLNVTKSLLKGRVDLAYIPSEEDSRTLPLLLHRVKVR